MKTLIRRSAAGLLGIFFLGSPLQAADNWVSPFSFPLTSNTGNASRGTLFTDPVDGFKYVYYGADTASGAQVWRSSDNVDWYQVNDNGFALAGSTAGAVAWFGSFTNAHGPAIYVGVPNNPNRPGQAAQIYRGTGGTSSSQWTLVFSSVSTGSFGQDVNPGGSAGAAFSGNYYIGTRNQTSGCEVWKSTSADWTDRWVQVSTGGFGGGAAQNAQLAYLSVFGGKLYAATNCNTAGPACGQLWMSTGTAAPTDIDTWTEVLSGSTTFSANTHSISALEVFGGNFYATTFNSVNGAQVFYSPTPNLGGPWTQVFSPDSACANCFGKTTAQEVHSLRNVAGVLYASTWDPTAGLSIYRSTDGTSWAKSTGLAGFGNGSQYAGDFAQGGANVVSDALRSAGGVLWNTQLPFPAFNTFSTQVSSISATYTSVGAAPIGLDMDASSTNFVGGTIYSSATSNTALLTLAPQGLDPNTTYFLRIGALYGSATSYFTSASAQFTLAQAPAVLPTTFLNVYQTSTTAAWAGFNSGAVSSNTAEGFTLQASSLNFNGGIFLTSATTNVSASTLTVFGLGANATYYFRVGSQNWANALNFTVLGTTVTQPVAPVSSLYSSVTSSGVVANWTSGANLNPSALTYKAILSTGPLPNSFSGNVSSVTFSTFAAFGLGGFGANLSPNTTYFAQVSATSTYWPSPVTLLGSTATLANAPSASTTTVYLSSVTLSWTANGNPAGTTYYAIISTDPAFGTLNQSASVVASSSVFLTGLAANTTFYSAVYAINRAGTQSAYSTYTVTSTLVAAPSSAPAANITTGSITVNWGAGGNSTTTVYTAVLSSDGFRTAIFTATTTATSNTFYGLIPNTLYQSSVSALGNNGVATLFVALPSTYTFMLSPATTTPSDFSSVNLSSVTVNWNSGGNPAGTTYVAYLSTGPLPNSFSSTVASNTLNTSVLYGTGGAGTALIPNTTYFAIVFASAGVNTSTYVSLGATSTLAAQPSATTVVAVASTTIQLTWANNGNPLAPSTTYELWIATSPGFDTPTKVTTGTAGYFATALTPLTSYYFMPRAKNNNGLFTLFDTAASTFTTAPQPPSPPAPTGVAVGVSSISWTWTLAANATSYNVFIGSNTAFFIGSSSFTGFVENTLVPDSTYTIAIAGVDSGGQGPFSSASAAVFTLATSPVGVSSPTVLVTSATVSWGLNGNPAGLTATVQRSTDNASFIGVNVTTTTSFVDTTLLGCSTYFYRVKNTNGAGIDTGFAASLQFNTQGSTPLPAGSLSASSLAGNKVSLTWTSSPFEGITRYRLFYDAGTGAVNYAAPLGVFTSTVTSFTTGALASTATYTFALRATNRCGIEETTGVFATASSTAALSAVRAALSSPQSGATVVGGPGSVAVLTASLLSGTPLSVSQVVFQFKAVAASTWTVISTSTLLPYTTSWSIASLSTGSAFNLRAVAFDLSGSPDSSPGAIQVTIGDPANPNQPPGTLSQTIVGGVAVSSLVVSNQNPSTLSVVDPKTGFTTSVSLPACAFGIDSFGNCVANSTATLSVVNNIAAAPAVPAGTTGTGIGTQVILTGGGTLARAATLVFSYSDPTNSGLINAAVGVDSVRLYSSKEGSGVWVQDVQTSVDKINHLITGLTSHFTFFAGIGTPAADLSGVRIYPVPWKPNGTNADEGKPFVRGDPASGITFDRLPGTVNIKIYTLTGQPVADFSIQNGPGILQWDGRNDSGRDVASGLYFAVISGPGFNTVTKKLLIIR